jgi:hypothetical protein
MTWELAVGCYVGGFVGGAHGSRQLRETLADWVSLNGITTSLVRKDAAKQILAPLVLVVPPSSSNPPTHSVICRETLNR